MEEFVFLAGKRAVWEALTAKNYIEEILFQRGKDRGLRALLDLASQQRIKLKEVELGVINSLYDGVHQGVLARMPGFKYAVLDDVLLSMESCSGFLMILDHLTDPHNLGAIIRTAAAFGAAGVVIPRDRSAKVTATVLKVASGGCEYVPVVMVRNIADTVGKLRALGVWVYATGFGGEDLFKVSFAKRVAIVVGAEGKGVSRLVAERSDSLLTIPMPGNALSFNVSVASGIIMGELTRQKT
ncbi:MAG: 23S rRNA (guanosine(2251)-2'-O)-methyltransferase RlmB, partial [Oscillospiraceae bacterium]|nr:23S rRNA (guanosine(2251)-2'-O)-methyltransferase RlmB [Oscillospiraceae bacterium]